MEDVNIISNQHITASTYRSDNEPWKGRLNNANGYWASENGDSTPWIQVAFPSAVTILAMEIQGAGNERDWVTDLRIQTGDSEEVLLYIMDGTEPAVSLCYHRNLTAHHRPQMKSFSPRKLNIALSQDLNGRMEFSIGLEILKRL